MTVSRDKPWCFIDFDGTLVNNRKRMYQFCCDYCCKSFESIMAAGEYWTLKRFGVNELDVVSKVTRESVDRAKYNALKLAHIEDERYLAMDELIPGTAEALSILGERYRLSLVSRREHPDRLIHEIECLGIEAFFDDIVIIPHGNEIKAKAIRERFDFAGDSLIIGDTEDDLSAGIELGIKSVFVLSGIRSAAWGRRFAKNGSIVMFGTLFDFARDLETAGN